MATAMASSVARSDTVSELTSAWPKLVARHMSTKLTSSTRLGHQVGIRTSPRGLIAVMNITANGKSGSTISGDSSAHEIRVRRSLRLMPASSVRRAPYRGW